MPRGALAGLAGAAAWAAVEPLVANLVRPPPGYSDVRVLGGLLAGRRRAWRVLGLSAHLVTGALFGVAFVQAGGRGWRQGLAAAELENVLLWPSMAVVDRVHPDRRNGGWPPLLLHGRAFAHELCVHAVFGLVLGALAGDRQSSSTSTS
jgi:hypothetical protein